MVSRNVETGSEGRLKRVVSAVLSRDAVARQAMKRVSAIRHRENWQIAGNDANRLGFSLDYSPE